MCPLAHRSNDITRCDINNGSKRFRTAKINSQGILLFFRHISSPMSTFCSCHSHSEPKVLWKYTTTGRTSLCQRTIATLQDPLWNFSHKSNVSSSTDKTTQKL